MGMGKHSRMHQGFMIYELIRLAGLDLAIKDETDPKAMGVDDLYGLKPGSPRVYPLPDAMQRS